MQTAKLDSARQPGRTSRADVPGYRNSNINAQSQWGGIAPTGKAAAQAAILQYSAASGAMGLIFLIATVTSSVPDVDIASSVSARLLYLPVPKINLELNLKLPNWKIQMEKQINYIIKKR